MLLTLGVDDGVQEGVVGVVGQGVQGDPVDGGQGEGVKARLESMLFDFFAVSEISYSVLFLTNVSA